MERYCSAEQIDCEPEMRQSVSEPELVKRVLTLVERAEYKRQQAAPVLKVTRNPLGWAAGSRSLSKCNLERVNLAQGMEATAQLPGKTTLVTIRCRR